MTLNALEKIYPCVTHENYLSELGDGNSLAADFGHDLALMLWHDLGSTMKNVSPQELPSLGVGKDELWDTAFDNFNRALNEGEIHFDVVGFPGDEKILVAGPHWLASALPTHGGLYPFVAEQIESSDVVVAVPAREKAIFFPKNCSEKLLSTVKEISGDISRESQKPFGWRLFSFSAEGAQPL
jgi:hypothetical protein